MKEQLELKHLAPYLPYKLKLKYGDNIVVMNTGEGSSKHWCGISAVIKRQDAICHPIPILRNISDLTKEIEHNGERFVPLRWFENEGYFGNDLLRGMVRNNYINTSTLPYCIIQKFFEWHIDIENLIEKGLAIDINTLTKEV